MTRFLIPTLVAIASLVSAGSAMAATRTFIVTGSDLEVFLGAEKSALGVSLEDAVGETAAVNITLPKNYKKNTPIDVQARFTTGGTNCGVVVESLAVVRLRPGANMSILDTVASGFTINGSGLLTIPATPLRVITKGFKLKRATTGSILNQKAGDNIVLLIARDSANGADTCPQDIIFTSAKVTYTSN